MTTGKTHVTTLTFYKEDYENMEKVKKFFWYKANTHAIRRWLQEIVNRNEL